MNTVVRVEDSKYLTGQGGSGGSGGHTIQNDSGTALPQESALQFVGVYSEDDPTNHKTKVNIIREMTKAQMDALSNDAKKGVIHTTDEADNPANPISAEDVTFDPTGTSLSSTDVDGAIQELGVVKKGTVTFTTDAKGTWAGTVNVGGYPLKAGELLSTYLDRASLSVVRKIEHIMYGYGGYLFTCTDGSGNPIVNTEVSVTCVYLKTP